MANVIVWADIPVLDLERARSFYAHLLGSPVEYFPGSTAVAILKSPGEMGTMEVGADLALGQSIPSTNHGPTVYLGSMGDIDGMLARAVEAGGTILAEKALMTGIGWITYILDTEGNRIGIHQPA